MKHHQMLKHSAIMVQLVLELTGVRCLTIPPGWLHDMSVQSGPYKLGHSDAHETLQVSPWPVPELTGVQWVEPLPQASYIALITHTCILPYN